MRSNRLARPLALLFLVVAGVTFSAALCSSYEAKASNVVNDGQERIKDIGEDAEADMTACGAGSLEACDRTMDAMSDMADEVERMHAELSELKPSKDAQQWHAEYLTMLAKAQWAIRAAVAAWESGDPQAIVASSGAFGDLEMEEARLTAYFNDKLR